MAELQEKIEKKIEQMGRGWAFSRKDISDIAPSGPVGVILSRLVARGMIRRIGRGLYDYPKKSDLVDEFLPPEIDQAARAIARKHRWTITPDGATAANTLGLSKQVPAKIFVIATCSRPVPHPTKPGR